MKNGRQAVLHWLFGVGCWLFDVADGGGLIVFCDKGKHRTPNIQLKLRGLNY
jgi:hypothetical protein